MMAVEQIQLQDFMVQYSYLVLWRGRTSPSVWALSSVFYASCLRSAAVPWAGCWTTPGRWSRNGPGCCCRLLPRRHSNHLRLSFSAELLLLFGRVLLKRKYNKNYAINCYFHYFVQKQLKTCLKMRNGKKDEHTWCLGTDSFQSQVLGVNFALIVRFGHHRRGEGHVTYMTHLRPVCVSVVTVHLAKTHTSTINHLWLQCPIKKRINCHVLTPNICSLCF